MAEQPKEGTSLLWEKKSQEELHSFFVHNFAQKELKSLEEKSVVLLCAALLKVKLLAVRAQLSITFLRGKGAPTAPFPAFLQPDSLNNFLHWAHVRD